MTSRNGLQRSDRRRISEIHGKKVPNRFGGLISGVLNRFLRSNHGKDSENRGKGVRNVSSRRLPHNIGVSLSERDLPPDDNAYGIVLQEDDETGIPSEEADGGLYEP